MDDASVNEFGGLPWERTVHAQIARRLGAAGAVVVWDVVFAPPPDNTAVRPEQAAQTAELANAIESITAGASRRSSA